MNCSKEIPARARHLTSRTLPKLVFEAELPEQFIRTLPVQSLYLALKHNGLSSSADLIAAASVEQCRLLIDFDCWQKDSFVEENFMEWLSLCDADQSLDLLHKIIKCIDLKLVALMISRYVQIHVHQEPTDPSPGEGFFTPDRGYTWVKVNTTDSHRQFLLARLLAAIFEASAEIFYQLMSVKGIATATVLEEEAYQDKQKRLAAEGIPDREYAHEINTPLEPAALQHELETKHEKAAVEMIPAVLPMLYDTETIQPLGEVLKHLDLEAIEQFESEFTLIMNAALVRWSIEVFNYEEVTKLSSKVKGAINLALELTLQKTGMAALEIYRHAGLQKLYACGLNLLFRLQKRAHKFSVETLQAAASEAATFAIVAGLRQALPEMPNFFLPDGTLKADPSGVLAKGYKAIEHLTEWESLQRFLDQQNGPPTQNTH
ncbi:MAG: hypothetical protein GX589_08215 [Deltaproteobacteria bacterium]|nr:hypothetical protein [Deltaproteobacteria bacterium]